MGRYKGVPEGRKSSKPPPPVNKGPTESRTSRLKRRRMRRRWLSSVATGVLVAVLAAGANGAFSDAFHAANRLISPPRQEGAPAPHAGKSSAPQPTSSGGGTPAGHNHSLDCSLQLVSEYSLDGREVRAWTFPTGFKLSPGQTAQLSEDHGTADLVNRDLYNDGGYAPFTDIQFIIQNTCSESATITDIWALKSCQSPLDGVIFAGQSELSEPNPGNAGTQLGINLDSSDPEAMVTNGWDTSQWTQEYAGGSLITIQGMGTHVVDIRSIALHSACSFSIQMRVLSNKKTYIQTFTDDGQPFRVSALLPGVLKSGKPGDYPYSGYGMLYVGWNASPWHDDTWAREDPKTYAGSVTGASVRQLPT